MIEPGTSSQFWVKLSDLEASIRSKGYVGSLDVHAVASDGLGNDYKSNTVSVGYEAASQWPLWNRRALLPARRDFVISFR
jgi:hypothetical protein